MSSNDMYGLAGAYVLDALDDEERAEFEAFLETSPEARAEVESLLEAASLLGAAAVETPPAGLRRSVMADIDATRQVPPVVTAIEDHKPARPQTQAAGPGWVTTMTRAVAAVVVIIAIGLGVAVTQLSSRLDSLEAANNRVATVVAAADAQRVSASLADGGMFSAVISPELGAAIIVGADLAALPEDRMYALWSITDGVPAPIGELVEGRTVAASGEGLSTLAVTVEPRGPLTAPTTEPIGVLEA